MREEPGRTRRQLRPTTASHHMPRLAVQLSRKVRARPPRDSPWRQNGLHHPFQRRVGGEGTPPETLVSGNAYVLLVKSQVLPALAPLELPHSIS
jgi:hypothetical protein